MSCNRSSQMSESFLLGGILAVVGGFLDAYTYLLRGGVFANAQTGNIVLLGLHFAHFHFAKAFYYLIPISAFIAGVVIVEAVKWKFQKFHFFHWRQGIVAAEFILLLAAAFIPQGSWDTAVNIAVSFVCAMQVESFRKVNGNAYATTMCTGNLRSASESFYRYAITKDPVEREKSLRYYGIILFVIGGAALVTWMSGLFAEKAVLFCCGLLGVVFLLMFLEKKD